MSKPVLSFIAAILVVVIDSVYLSSVKGYFGKQIKDVQGTPMKLDMMATVLAYVFIVFGLNYFIIRITKIRYRSIFIIKLIYHSIIYTYITIINNINIT